MNNNLSVFSTCRDVSVKLVWASKRDGA